LQAKDFDFPRKARGCSYGCREGAGGNQESAPKPSILLNVITEEKKEAYKY
jgi:hypothetical protein